MEIAPVNTEKTQSVLEHVYELRKKIFIAIGSVILGSSIAHIFNKELISFFLKPAGEQQLVFLSPLDPLFLIIKVDLFVGIIIAFPIILWSIFSYVKPALPDNINKKITILYFFSIFLLIVGAYYAYFITIPVSLKFLFSIIIPGIQSTITVQNYLSFFLGQSLVVILIFQVPLLIITSIYSGIISPDFLSSKRRYVYLFGTIALAVLTPTTDIFNLGIMLIPAFVIFEGSLLISRFLIFLKKKPKNIDIV